MVDEPIEDMGVDLSEVDLVSNMWRGVSFISIN
jgi:hypothetical protein